MLLWFIQQSIRALKYSFLKTPVRVLVQHQGNKLSSKFHIQGHYLRKDNQQQGRLLAQVVTQDLEVVEVLTSRVRHKIIPRWLRNSKIRKQCLLCVHQLVPKIQIRDYQWIQVYVNMSRQETDQLHREGYFTQEARIQERWTGEKLAVQVGYLSQLLWII